MQCGNGRIDETIAAPDPLPVMHRPVLNTR